MTTGASLRYVLTKIVLVLTVSLTVLVASGFVGLDSACGRQNGTVCNRRAPEDCRFQRPGLNVQNLDSALNHDALISVTIRMNLSDPLRHLRYFKLEWTQASSRGQNGPTFVRVSPLAQGHLLLDQGICLSNVAIDATVKEETDDYNSDRNGVRHSILLPTVNNAVSSLVEVYTRNLYTEILVVLPEYSRHSFIIQGLSITVRYQTAYISLSRPPSRVIGNYYHIEYTLTLQCYKYVERDGFSHCENSSKLNISPSSLVPTFCSDAHNEIIITLDRSSPGPIVFEMMHPAYELMVDAKLINIASESVVGTKSLRTPKFGCAFPGIENVSSSIEVSSSGTWTTLTAQLIRQDPGVKDPVLQLAPVAESSVSAYSEKDQNATKDNSITIMLGVCLPFAALMIVLGVTLTWIKRRAGKRNSNTVRQVSVPEKYDAMESSKRNLENHYNALESKNLINSERKLKLRPDWCQQRYSSSSDNLSDLLDSTSKIVNESLHHKYNSQISEQSHENFMFTKHNQDLQRNNVKIEVTLNNLPVSSNGIQDCTYNILVNGKTPQKQSESDIECHPDFNHDRVQKYTDKQKYFHKLVTGFSHEDQTYNGSSDLGRDWHSMSSFIESTLQMEDLIEPKFFAGTLEPQTMLYECMKINQRYEDFFEHGVDMQHLQSSEVLTEGECYSICESVVC